MARTPGPAGSGPAPFITHARISVVDMSVYIFPSTVCWPASLAYRTVRARVPAGRSACVTHPRDRSCSNSRILPAVGHSSGSASDPVICTTHVTQPTKFVAVSIRSMDANSHVRDCGPLKILHFIFILYAIMNDLLPVSRISNVQFAVCSKHGSSHSQRERTT